MLNLAQFGFPEISQRLPVSLAGASGGTPLKGPANFVETTPPNGAGTTNGMLGFMFWAAGCQGQGTGCTFPPTTCEGGMGVACTTFNIPIPMPALRTQ